MSNGNKLLTSENAGKVTLLGFAMFLLAGAYQMFTASGWKLGNEFYAGVVLCAIAGVVLLVREYLKRKYPGTEPELDFTDVDSVIAAVHKYRDFIRDHAQIELAAADMVIESLKASGASADAIAKAQAVRDKWAKLLASL